MGGGGGRWVRWREPSAVGDGRAIKEVAEEGFCEAALQAKAGQGPHKAMRKKGRTVSNHATHREMSSLFI